MRHWRKEYPSNAWDGHPREDITGLYEVGDAELDLTDTADKVIRGGGTTLHLELAEDIILVIVEQRELPQG